MLMGQYDAKIDVWACGMIAHLLLTHELPFGLMELNDDEEILEAISQMPKLEISRKNFQHISENGIDFLKNALQCDP